MATVKKLTYGIDAAAIGLAKLAPNDSDRPNLERVHIRDGRAYVADGFIVASADLPVSDPSDLDEDSAVSFPAAEIAELPWEDWTQRAYSLVKTKDTRLGEVLRSGDTVRLAHGTPVDPQNPGPLNGPGIRSIAEAQHILDKEPITTVLGVNLLGGLLDVLREVCKGIEGGVYYGGAIVLRIFPDDPDAPSESAPRSVEWVFALPDGRTIEGMIMPMVLPTERAIVPHWRLAAETAEENGNG